MKTRIPFANLIPDQINKLVQLNQSVESSLDETIFCIAHNRASQLNGCAFCLDMDVKKAKIRGERELRMYHIAVWRDSPLFTERERAALEWTEAVTRLKEDGVSDEVFNRVREHFSEKEVAELTFAIGMINLWNRLNVSARSVPGSMDTYFGLDKSGLK